MSAGEPLDRDGFLSRRTVCVRRAIRRKNAEFFQFARTMNRLAHDLLFEVELDTENAQELLLVCLFQRAVTTYQAVVILCEKGLQPEAMVQLRTLLDVMFRLVAIAKDPKVGLLYIQQDERTRKRLVRKFTDLSEGVKANIDLSAIERVREDVDRALALQNPPEGSTEWFANKADLRDFYLSAYAILSSTVHVNVRDLEAEFQVNADGTVLGFNYKPRTDKLKSTLSLAFEALVFCMRGSFTVLKTKRFSEVESIHKMFRALHMRTFESGTA